MIEIFIRLANIKDAEQIADISRETFFQTFAPFNTKSDMVLFMSEQFSKEKLIEQVSEKGNTFLLAYVNNKISGYAFLKVSTNGNISNDNAIEISRIYVRDPFIGKGVGKSLMKSAISIAKEMNKRIIWLGVWKYNQRAVLFYTSIGFEKIGEHDFLLGEDLQRDWVMQLLL